MAHCKINYFIFISINIVLVSYARSYKLLKSKGTERKADVIVFPEWAVEDDGCRTPDRGKGTCVSIRECKPVNDILENAPQPLSQGIIKLLKSYQCGFQGNLPKVCCPPRPINIGLEPPDVSKHRNIGLLPKECGFLDTDDKIINGNKTGLLEFPWMTLLSYKTGNGNEFKCGGTVISERYILTAAHCIKNTKYSLIGVRVGEHNIKTDVDCGTINGEETCAPKYQDLAVEEIIPYPTYNITLYSNDIGLLRVEPIDLTKVNARAVCLPLDINRNYNFTDRNVIVTGWGATETVRQSPELLKAEIPFTKLETCRKTYADVAQISYKQLCAGGKNKTDTCAGDSGGPLHTVGRLNDDVRYIQQGIVSFGPRFCGLEGYPGVYTKVAHYMDWILDNMKP